jgi:hypothetical protein
MAEGFFWGQAKPGEPGSYESLQARRRIAESLLGKRSPYPKNIGEGIASLGESIGDTLMLRDLDRRERAQGIYQAGLLGGLAPAGGSYAPGALPPAAGVPPPAAGLPPVGGGGAVPPPARTVSVDPASPYYRPLAGEPGSPLSLPLGRMTPGTPTMEYAREPISEKDIPERVAIYDPGDVSPIDARDIYEGPGFRTRRNEEVGKYVGFDKAVEGLDPAMQAALIAAKREMPPHLRDRFMINEGFRTPEYQAYLFNKISPRGGMVGRPGPGGSRHQNLTGAGGRAVDVDPGEPLDWLQANASRFGLEGIGRGDWGHIQMQRRPLPDNVRTVMAELLAARDAPATAAPATAAPAAAAPAAVPSPGPAAPTSATPLLGGPADDTIAAVPPAAAAVPPAAAAMPPNPVNPTNILPMPAGAFSPTPIGQQLQPDFGPPPAPPAPAAPVAALAAAGAMPPVAPEGAAGAPSPVPPPGVPSPAYRPPWLRGLEEGGFGNPTGPAAAATSPLPAPVPAPAAALPPAAAPPAAAAPPVLGPAGPSPDTGTIGKAPIILPGINEPLPASGLVHIPPYEEPLKEPSPRAMSEPEQKALALTMNPNVDERTRAIAQAHLQRYQEARQAADARDYEKFKHERGLRDTRMAERDKIMRERPKEGLAELKARVDLAKTPVEFARATADLEKAIVDVDIAKQQREAGKAPEHIKFENGKFGLWDATTRTFKDITPQINPLDIDLPAEIGKKVEYFTAARDASNNLKDARALTALGDALANRGLGILGPYVVKPEHQLVYNRALAWNTAILRHESGAQISDKEIERQMTTFWPVPGEPRQVSEQKQLLREQRERSLYLSLGKGRPVADFYLERRVNAPDGTIIENPKTGEKRIIRNGLAMDMPDGK